MGNDALDAAIEAADKPQPVEMQQINITIASTGRPAIVAIPTDVTDSELAELTGFLLTTVMATKRAERASRTGPSLVIARGPLAALGKN